MSDDRFSLDRLLGVQNGQTPDVPRIMPASGLICPRCGFEPKLDPQGRPTDSGWWSNPLTGKQDSPFYHQACIGAVLMERDFAYVKEHLQPWIPKEQYRAPGTYVALDAEGKEVKDAGSSPTE